MNTAETYFEELIATEVWGFTNFTDLTKDYHRWCDERSYTPLGKKAIAHAAKTVGYERKTFRQEEKLITRYVCESWSPEELAEIHQRWGMFQKEDSDIELTESENTVESNYDKLLELL